MNMSNYVTQNDEFNAAIPARYIKALSHMMAKNDVRYYLNGIHVKHGVVEASDGHVAMRIESPDIIVKVGEKFIISVDTVKYICSGMKVNDLSSTVYITDGKVFGSHADFVYGTYPDVGRILIDPNDCSGEVGQFNPELLVRIQKAVKTLWPKVKRNKGAFELHHNGIRGAAVKFENESETVKGVVMPWRV